MYYALWFSIYCGREKRIGGTIFISKTCISNDHISNDFISNNDISKTENENFPNFFRKAGVQGAVAPDYQLT